MAILLISGQFDPTPWINELKKIDSTLDIRIWPDTGNVADIQFALVWHYPKGELVKYPHLKCISSLGAGVDHLLSDDKLPLNVPIVRVIDSTLMRDMTQYVIWAVLNYTRLADRYRKQQSEQHWQQHGLNNEITIGILGLGQLGADAARKLVMLGFKVNGWSRTPKTLTGIHCFSGKKEFDSFLKQSQLLINLLPLTPETRNILNRDLFYRLPKGAYLINAGRGGHLVEEDLIAAIQDGQIAGACLDVFQCEPLPTNHPLWRTPNVIITPHIASVTNPKSVAIQVLENYRRVMAGKPLLNQVDIQRGY